MIFAKASENELDLLLKDTPIMQIQTSNEKKLSISSASPLMIAHAKQNKRSKTVLLSFTCDGESFSAYVRSRDRFKIKELCQQFPDYIKTDEKALNDIFERM